MAYEKRVCVLKQMKKGFSADGSALSGAVYCERLGSELTVTPRLLGLAPVTDGRYVLVLGVGGQHFCLPLMGGEQLRVENAPSIGGGFSALLAFVRGEAEPVAFGACGTEKPDAAPLLAALGPEEKPSEAKSAEKSSEKKSGGKRPAVQPLPPIETPAPAIPSNPLAPAVPLPGPPFREGYDDEAIAADDYFALSSHAHAEGGDGGEAQEVEEPRGGDAPSHEAAPYPRGTLTYYKEIKERIDEAFSRFPPDTRLKGSFPYSDWVRAEDALLGIVYAEGMPRYLCVAVEKRGDPPEEMKSNCSFVPAGPFSEEEGFWVVFQDADTGAYVRVYDE